jgi:hypothetical protein
MTSELAAVAGMVPDTVARHRTGHHAIRMQCSLYLMACHGNIALRKMDASYCSNSDTFSARRTDELFCLAKLVRMIHAMAKISSIFGKTFAHFFECTM